MTREVDWRHWTAGLIVLLLLMLVGWAFLARPLDPPKAEAPRGPQARMRDAPEATLPGTPVR